MKRIAIVTGASSGMGKEFVRQITKKMPFLDEIWIIARRKERMEEIAGDFLQSKIKILAMDLEKEASWEIYEEKLKKEMPKVLLLVNAAGYGKIGISREIPWQEQTGMARLNCEALVAVTQITLPFIKRGGRIIEVASASAFIPQPGFNVYAASKAFVLSYARGLNQELKKDKISVTAVCPGPVETEFFERAQEIKETPAYKKFFRASKEKVVEKALEDARKRKEVSVYGIAINAMRIAVKILPHKLILKGFRCE